MVNFKFCHSDLSRDISPEAPSSSTNDEDSAGLVLAQRELPWKTNTSEVTTDPARQGAKGRRYRTISTLSNEDRKSPAN